MNKIFIYSFLFLLSALFNSLFSQTITFEVNPQNGGFRQKDPADIGLWSGEISSSTSTNATIQINSFMPLGWNYELMVDAVKKNSGDDINLSSNNKAKFSFKIIPNQSSKIISGLCELVLISSGKSTKTTFRLYPKTSDILVLGLQDDSYLTDSENDKFVLRLEKNKARIAETSNILNKGENSATILYDSRDFTITDLFNYKAIFFNLNNAVLNPNGIEYLKGFLENENSILVMGENVASGLGDSDSAQYNDAYFLKNFLCTDYKNTGSMLFNSVNGTPNEPITTGLSFRLDDGEIPKEKLNPDLLAPVNGGVQICHYGSISSRCAGVKRDTIFKTITFGFPLQAIGNKSTATTLVNNSIKWLLTKIKSVENETNSEFSLLNTVPNPASNIASLHFNLKNSGHGVISLFNSNGKSITVLQNKFFEAGEQFLKINVNDLESGLYFYTLNFNGVTAKKSFNVVK